MTFGTWQKVAALYIKRSTRIGKLSLQQYRACVVDSLGLGIVSYITVLYILGIPILSLLIFMPSLYSHSNFYIYLYVYAVIFNHNVDVQTTSSEITGNSVANSS